MQFPSAPSEPIATERGREDFEITTSDGQRLAASWFGDREPSHVVLIAPATGVARRFYRAFARHLAGRGFGVLTWDWRGIGDSRPRSLRGFEATMREWGVHDLASAIAAAVDRVPEGRRVVVGHSFGGQAVGLAPNRDQVHAMVLVGAQVGWWGHWPSPDRYALAALWHVVVPTFTHTLGYLPGWLFGSGEDLPRGVALEWARWCRSPSFLGDFSGHAEVRAPLLAYAVDDDFFAPRAAVEALVARYGSDRRTIRQVAPASLGLRRLGHFGFFRQDAEPLWEETADWIAAIGG
jgi:predicted alpha/beta hydrolase